jgi:hypothetical protein
MKRNATLVLILGCMLVSGSLYALAAQDEKEAASPRETADGKHRPPVKQRSQKPAKPAATFKPSERIGADSAVSFPVDI